MFCSSSIISRCISQGDELGTTVVHYNHDHHQSSRAPLTHMSYSRHAAVASSHPDITSSCLASAESKSYRRAATMNTMAPHWPVFLGTHASTHALQHYVSYLRVSSACGLIYLCASLPVCASAKASSRTRPRGQHLMTAMHLIVEGARRSTAFAVECAMAESAEASPSAAVV